MASGKKRKIWGSAWMDDTYEWAAAMGSESGVALQISLSPSRRRYCWRVLVRVLEVVDGKPAGIRVQDSSEWPTAEMTALDVHVFQRLSHLALRMEEDALMQAQRAP